MHGLLDGGGDVQLVPSEPLRTGLDGVVAGIALEAAAAAVMPAS